MRTANLSTGNRGGIVITHREYIGDVTPSANFAIRRYDINPGLTPTFPWLADLADAYDEYEVRAIVFEYKSLCSQSTTSASGTLGMGSVIMATNYNQHNINAFVDKRTMENYEGSSSKRPQDSNIHIVDVKKASTPVAGLKWVRTGPVPEDADVRLYDIGQFCLATQGQPSDVSEGTIGELWVAYEIEFFKPKFTGAIGGALRLDHWSLAMPTGYTQTYCLGDYGATPTTSLPANKTRSGSALLHSWQSEIGTAFGYNSIKFDPTTVGMTFLITISWTCPVRPNPMNAIIVDLGATGGVVGVPGFENQTSDSAGPELGSSTAQGAWIYKFTVVPNNVTPGNHRLSLKFADGALGFYGGVGTYMDIYVTQINGTLEL